MLAGIQQHLGEEQHHPNESSVECMSRLHTCVASYSPGSLLIIMVWVSVLHMLQQKVQFCCMLAVIVPGNKTVTNVSKDFVVLGQ